MAKNGLFLSSMSHFVDFWLKTCVREQKSIPSKANCPKIDLFKDYDIDWWMNLLQFGGFTRKNPYFWSQLHTYLNL